MILTKEGLDIKISDSELDPEGRFIFLDTVIQDSRFCLINIYAPNKVKDQKVFFESLISLIDQKQTDCGVIIGGDFKVAPNPSLDCQGGNPVQKESFNQIKDLSLSNDLVDFWRIRNPDLKKFTWSQKSPFIQRRLDYWLISDYLQDDVNNTFIKPAIKTDHSAIILQLNGIKGVVVEDEEIKLCAFADDLTTFLRDVSSYKNLVESLHRFEQCSGLKVNSDKTEALSLGVEDPNNSIVELGISKIEIPNKILGIHWTCNQQERDKLNFYNLLESIKKQLTFFKWRHLTIIGKIQILKTFIIPKLTYRASIIHYSKDTLKQCNKILYDFVWNGRDKVKRMARFILETDHPSGTNLGKER